MHDLKLQYFKNSGKWYMDEGYHNEESRLKIPDILYDDLDGMSQLNLRSKVYDMGLSELKSSGLTYGMKMMTNIIIIKNLKNILTILILSFLRRKIISVAS